MAGRGPGKAKDCLHSYVTSACLEDYSSLSQQVTLICLRGEAAAKAPEDPQGLRGH